MKRKRKSIWQSRLLCCSPHLLKQVVEIVSRSIQAVPEMTKTGAKAAAGVIGQCQGTYPQIERKRCSRMELISMAAACFLTMEPGSTHCMESMTKAKMKMKMKMKMRPRTVSG